MQPGGGEHGCTAQDNPPAAVLLDEDAPPHSTPPLPAIVLVASEEKQQQPALSLPEGPLVEILARVPYRSLCRFKCVSKPWLALCSSRDILKRSPQTLSGFFYYHHTNTLRFRNLSGRGLPLVDPSLPPLRERYKRVLVKEFCGGLLLCRCWKPCSIRGESDYVVCNPATEEWTILPPIIYSGQVPSPLLGTYLGFDMSAPSRFMVFATLSRGGNDSGNVAIYSSETGQWTCMHSKWASGTRVDLDYSETHVFLNGTLHLPTSHNSILTVDMEGKIWREIKMPDELPSRSDIVYIGQSQGRVYAWQMDTSHNPHDCQLYICVLEDYGTGKWTLKHHFSVLELFGRHCHKDDKFYPYEMFAVHPDCNVIFLTDGKTMTVSYNLDDQKVDLICTESMYGIPYIPCFAELPSAGH